MEQGSCNTLPLRRLFLYGEQMRASPTEVASYVGSFTAVASSLTLTDIGVIVGILTALATFGLNFFFMWRKDRREQRESDLRILEMGRHDG